MHKPNEAECRCGCRVRMAISLANTFKPLNWGDDEVISVEEAMNWLSIDEDEVQTLVITGLLPSWNDCVKLTELVKFVEETNWFHRRADVYLAHLQDKVAWLATREAEREIEKRAAMEGAQQ